MDIPIPVFFGLVTDERNNAVAGGFGTNLNPERAALKALFECVQNRLGQLPMRSDWGRDLYNRKIRKTIFESAATSPSSEGFSRMTDLNTNLHAYLEPQSHHLLDGIRSDAPPVPLSSIVNRSRGTARDDAEICLGMLEHKGFDVIVTDLTHEDVSDLGFVVLRVSVPGLVPNSVTAWPHLGNPRLYTVPPKLGFPHKSEADMATFPMPYA
jgi:thiazole/oxazole-forming peptide maturase SagD family component